MPPHYPLPADRSPATHPDAAMQSDQRARNWPRLGLQRLAGPEGAELWWHPAWLSTAEADAMQRALREQVPWEAHSLRLFGREVTAPRLSCWLGDPHAHYRYSGTDFAPMPWTPALSALREALRARLGVAFDSVLANRYRDGRDGMGWHADDEPELGPAPVIASLSLGATRRFLVRGRHAPDQRLALPLTHGSLLVMAGATQRVSRHALPKTATNVGERINLTFRCILGAR